MNSPDTTLPCIKEVTDCPLLQELLSLRTRVKRLEKEVHNDELTGLYNRRHFNHCLIQELERTKRTFQPTSLILLDIDHFKNVNDTYGHPIGDLAIQHVAKAVTHDLRRLDIACRYGGEEYAIILPGTSIHIASAVANRLHQRILNVPVMLPDGRILKLTASLGVASANADSEAITPKALISLADKALYNAKNNGRNCIVTDTSSTSTTCLDEIN